MSRLLPVLLCVLAACNTPTGDAQESEAVLAVAPSGAGLDTEISSIVRGTSERDGHRVVSLDLRNDTDRTLRFAWAVEWMDRTGELCPGTPTEWRTAYLDAGETAPIEIEAPSPRAASWRLLAVQTAR